MTRHIERQIEHLKQKILLLGTLVEEAISKSITALINRDASLAQRVMANDDEIDRMEVEVEEECLKMLALYQPVAADLRFVVAALKINNDLERMGDLAKNIAKRVSQLCNGEPCELPPEIASTPWSTPIHHWHGKFARRTMPLTKRADTSAARFFRALRASLRSWKPYCESIRFQSTSSGLPTWPRTSPKMLFTWLKAILFATAQVIKDRLKADWRAD